MVAHTGIAATLLINGSTVHRQFAIPIGTTEETKCQVGFGTTLEKQIEAAHVIIWDEACMSDRRVSKEFHNFLNHPLKVLNCVEKLLTDIKLAKEGNSNPFGGKMMLLGGDWKQLLPVVRSTYGVELLDYTLKRSEFWKDFEVKFNLMSSSL